MIAGRKVVTFCSASSPSAASSVWKPHALHELGEADARGRIVLDDEHALAGSVRKRVHVVHVCIKCVASLTRAVIITQHRRVNSTQARALQRR